MREGRKKSSGKHYFILFYFWRSGRCLSILPSFRFYISKAHPPGRQLKWPWNQSDQTHQWGNKCCWLVFTAVTGKCLSNWNINDAGNENRKMFISVLWNKRAEKACCYCSWETPLGGKQSVYFEYSSNWSWLPVYPHFKSFSWYGGGESAQSSNIKAILLFRRSK